MRIATVSAGYADGYPRALSGKIYILIGGKKAPVIGRVCMDQMLVDVTDIPDVKMGDEVVLFGKDLSVDILAKLSNTINYEIVCGISPRVPRVIIK
jgi:alanine racemase